MIVLRIAMMRDPILECVKRTITSSEVVSKNLGRVDISDVDLLEVAESMGVPGRSKRIEYTVSVRGSRERGRVKVLVMQSTGGGSIIERPKVIDVSSHD